MNSLVARARSFLFVPASRPERFVRALDSGADCVVLDLEDGVAADQKDIAREHIEAGLRGFGRSELARVLVCINSAGTPAHAGDLALLARCMPHGLAGAMVPKADSPAVLRAVGLAMGPGAHLVPIVETLAGLDSADLLARAPQVARLAFGHMDFQLDLGLHCGADEAELAPARFALVTATRRARLAPPIDGVTTDTGNLQGLLAAVQRARGFGFAGKMCVHPTQVQAVNEAFEPSAADLDWARRVLAGAARHQGAIFSLDGYMVNLPVIRLAERTLKQGGMAA